ncbi:MAG: hypothetical protein PVI23_04950 [Maricaulaceae bacterium]|jgi:hypothetical protein
MSRTRIALLAAGSIGAIALAAPASAQSYMQQCTALIESWSACTESGESCETQYSAVEEECKCHTYRRGEWVLVDAAVAANNVCGEPPTTIIVPPPPPPPPTEIVGDPRGGGGNDPGEEFDPRNGRPGGNPPRGESPRGTGGGDDGSASGSATGRAQASETRDDD